MSGDRRPSPQPQILTGRASLASRTTKTPPNRDLGLVSLYLLLIHRPTVAGPVPQWLVVSPVGSVFLRTWPPDFPDEIAVPRRAPHDATIGSP